MARPNGSELTESKASAVTNFLNYGIICALGEKSVVSLRVYFKGEGRDQAAALKCCCHKICC